LDLLEELGHLCHWIVLCGQRCVAAGAPEGRPKMADLLFGDHDRVEPPPSHLKAEPAELADGVFDPGE